MASSGVALASIYRFGIKDERGSSDKTSEKDSTLALAVMLPGSSCLAKLFLLDGFDFGLRHNKSIILRLIILLTFLHLHLLEGEDRDVPASEKLWALVHEQSVPADFWCCCLPPTRTKQ